MTGMLKVLMPAPTQEQRFGDNTDEVVQDETEVLHMENDLADQLKARLFDVKKT